VRSSSWGRGLQLSLFSLVSARHPSKRPDRFYVDPAWAHFGVVSKPGQLASLSLAPDRQIFSKGVHCNIISVNGPFPMLSPDCSDFPGKKVPLFSGFSFCFFLMAQFFFFFFPRA